MYILYKAALSGLSLEASVVTFYIYFYISLRVTVFVRLVLLFVFYFLGGGWFLFFGVRAGVSDPPNIWCVQFGLISFTADWLWLISFLNVHRAGRLVLDTGAIQLRAALAWHGWTSCS